MTFSLSDPGEEGGRTDTVAQVSAQTLVSTVGLFLVSLSIASCCDPSVQEAVTGRVVDGAGEPVIPTRVELALGERTQECSVGTNTFSCFEFGRGGTYIVRVFLDSSVHEEQIEVDYGINVCHLDTVDLDIVVQ